jgi:hypothetical protein
MQANRRDFVKYAMTTLGALAVSGGTMLLTACGNVAEDIITAFQSVLTILQGAGVVPGGALVADVSAALSAVLSEVTAYANAPATDKTSTGLKLATLIQEAQAQLQTFWNDLKLTGVLATVVEGVVTVILSTLAGFLPTLPTPIAQSDVVMKAARLPRHLNYVPQKLSAKQFRATVNKLMAENKYPKVF